jgi:hypothetical protein
MAYYKIEQQGSDKPRLVQADNPSAALRHAAKKVFTVSPPLKQAELVKLMTSGVVAEDAGTEPAATTETGTED